MISLYNTPSRCKPLRAIIVDNNRERNKIHTFHNSVDSNRQRNKIHTFHDSVDNVIWKASCFQSVIYEGALNIVIGFIQIWFKADITILITLIVI